MSVFNYQLCQKTFLPNNNKLGPSGTASGNVASMREPLEGSLWWYWIAANAAKKNGASFKNYHRLSHLFYLCGVQIRQSLLCNMRDWSQG